jgi:hypothetical protein
LETLETPNVKKAGQIATDTRNNSGTIHKEIHDRKAKLHNLIHAFIDNELFLNKKNIIKMNLAV